MPSPQSVSNNIPGLPPLCFTLFSYIQWTLSLADVSQKHFLALLVPVTRTSHILRLCLLHLICFIVHPCSPSSVPEVSPEVQEALIRFPCLPCVISFNVLSGPRHVTYITYWATRQKHIIDCFIADLLWHV